MTWAPRARPPAATSAPIEPSPTTTQVLPDTSSNSWRSQRSGRLGRRPALRPLEVIEHRPQHELGDRDAVGVGLGEQDPLPDELGEDRRLEAGRLGLEPPQGAEPPDEPEERAQHGRSSS